MAKALIRALLNASGSECLVDKVDNSCHLAAKQDKCSDNCCAHETTGNSVLNGSQTIFFSEKLHYVLFHLQTPFMDTMPIIL